MLHERVIATELEIKHERKKKYRPTDQKGTLYNKNGYEHNNFS